MNLLRDFNYNYPLGINELKLKDLLILRNDYLLKDEIKTMFPPVEIGSITLVDQIVLLLLEKLIKPRVILEVGTYLGYTAKLFLNNSEASVISIDLPGEDVNINSRFELNDILQEGDSNDEFLRINQAINGEIYLKEITNEQNERLNLVKSDSTAISFLDKFGILDYVFIDGGHSYEIIKSDTLNARAAVKNGVIIWHDFNSNIHSDVTKFLKEESQSRKIFHVKGSLCAFEIIEGV